MFPKVVLEGTVNEVMDPAPPHVSRLRGVETGLALVEEEEEGASEEGLLHTGVGISAYL